MQEFPFTTETSKVRLARTGSVVESTVGMLKGDEPPLSAEEMRAAGEKAIAEESVARSWCKRQCLQPERE